jgi:hypothetical protein
MTPMSSQRGDMGVIAPPPIFHHLRKLGWSPPLLRSTTTQVAAVTCYRREAATAARSPSPTSPSGPLISSPLPYTLPLVHRLLCSVDGRIHAEFGRICALSTEFA